MFQSSDSPSSSPIEVHALEIITKAFNAAIDEIKKRAETAELRASANIPKIGSVTRCNGCETVLKYTLEKYTNGQFGENSIEEIEKKYLPLFAKARQVDDEIHARNIPIIESNKLLIEKIKALMAGIGIKSEYSERKFSRNGNYKCVTAPAGYLTDLTREICVSDGYDRDTQAIDCRRREYDEYMEKRKIRDRANAVAEEESKRKEQYIKKLAVIASRYTVSDDATASYVLDIILNANKYLLLAHSMLIIRNDWGDGCRVVSTALSNFSNNDSVCCDDDGKIMECVQKAIESFGIECDGRVFRDCEWNYEKLFSIVEKSNPQLYTDYCSVVAMLDIFD